MDDISKNEDREADLRAALSAATARAEKIDARIAALEAALAETHARNDELSREACMKYVAYNDAWNEVLNSRGIRMIVTVEQTALAASEGKEP